MRLASLFSSCLQALIWMNFSLLASHFFSNSSRVCSLARSPHSDGLARSFRVSSNARTQRSTLLAAVGKILTNPVVVILFHDKKSVCLSELWWPKIPNRDLNQKSFHEFHTPVNTRPSVLATSCKDLSSFLNTVDLDLQSNAKIEHTS